MPSACDYLRSAPLRRMKHPLEESPLWGVLGTILATVVAIVISLPLLFAFLLVLPVCASFRWLLFQIHHRRLSAATGVDAERVKGNERRWLGGAWKNSVVHSVLVFDHQEGLTVDHFRRLFTSRILPVYPRFTRLPVSLPMTAGSGHCWLPDSQFSIARHVLAGPQIISCDKDIHDYVASLQQSGLPHDKPPWEFHVITPQGELKDTIVIVRVHQSIADGTTLLRVLCHSLADVQSLDIPERPQFGCLAFGLNVFRACLTGPFTLFLWLCLTAGDCNPLTRRCSWTGAVTVTWSASITLPKVMRIKQVTRSTVNCVVLSALAGALRRLLQTCGVRQPPNVKVLVPLDIRSQPSSKADSTALGNKGASVVLPLPVAVEGCVPRLWAMRRTLSTLRGSSDPVLVYLATAALMSVAPAATTRYLLDLLADKASLQFSCLSGPTSQLYIGGERMKQMYCILPAPAKVGISVTAITYADQVQVSVASERALGPAGELLLEYMENQVEVLWKLLLNRRVPGENKITCFGYTPEIIDSPVHEIESRLTLVQKEVVRLTEEANGTQEAKLALLKAEFTHLVGELKRRQSLCEREKEESDGRTRRRALSCSSSRHSALSLKNLLPARASSHHLSTNEVICEEGSLEICYSINNPHQNTKSRLKSKLPPVETPIRSQASCDPNTHRETLVIQIESREKKEENSNLVTQSISSQKHRKNSFEIIRDRNKRTYNRPTITCASTAHNNNSKPCPGHSLQETKASHSIDESLEPLRDSESEDNTIDTETDYSDHTIKISDDETMDLDYDDMKTAGPINKNLRDLYCSNYLDYKLEKLRKKESQLSQKMIQRSQEFYRDIDDNDVDDGLLI